ncbi:MAG: peptidoglycan DD-metalloendopeptidase family protein [Rikenellaceae bacterium]
MRVHNIIIVLLLLVMTQGVTRANDQVAKQKSLIATLERQVADGEKEIESLRKSRAANEQKATSLARQVEARNRLLSAQRSEEVALRNEIAEADLQATSLSERVEVERSHYAQMVREAYRNYNNHNMLTYLFAAKDFQDVARRVANMRAVAQLREQRIELIDSLSTELENQRQILVDRKLEHDKVISDLTVQKNRLQSDVNSARANVKTMSAKERKALQEKELQQRKLDAAVAELQKLVKGNKAGASFTASTSNLNLPVVGGRVKQYKDNMAEILGPKDARIISIYEGKVVDIRPNRITGKYDVYIAHGEYITSYAGLYSVSVAKDQTVAKGAQIGVIGEAVDIITMQSEYKIVFGIYPPSTTEKVSAASCFKK